MNLEMKLKSFSVKFFDDLVENGIAGLIAVDFDQESERAIVLNNWESFFAEFFETIMKNFQIFIISALATVIEDFSFVEAFLDVSFGNIEDNCSFNFMAGASGNGHDLVFFAIPTTDRRKN